MKWIRKLFLILFLLAVACILFFMGYYYAVTKNLSLQPDKLLLSQTQLRIYDESGRQLQTPSSLLNQQSVDVQFIPDATKNAFIITEDKRFYQHNGFDFKRIVKAAYNNIKTHSFKEGASTISQQLIKNTHLSQEKTFKRKLQEWKLTRQLEKAYTKEEILEKYLNSIYFGHNCFGLVAASEFYFQKTPDELSLADSAILAGLVKSPNFYSPFKNPDRCQQRKQSVLGLMHKNEKITITEKLEAAAEELPIQTLEKQNNHSQGYLQFVWDELSEIAEMEGFSLGGNIEIFTYLNRDFQQQIEEIVKNADISCNKSIFVLDNNRRAFQACVSDFGNLPRLPGSLIKPLLCYAPAIEENLLSPATPILDEKIDYSGYTPENFDKTFHGYVSARECLEKSLNVPAVKILSSLGIDKACKYMRNIDMPISKEDETLALALGGMKQGYTMRDIIQGYATLANGGVFEPCRFISATRINGAFVYKRKTTQSRVFSEETSFLTTDMLKSTAKTGTAKKLRDLPFDIAAKTGTVGVKNSTNSDAYALAYTTQHSFGVWLGNKDNSPIPYTGGGLPCNLLYQICNALYPRQNHPPAFKQPANVVRIALDKNAYYASHTLELADDATPPIYRLYELFKSECLPTRKSTFFSNPNISTPTLQWDGNNVTIFFDPASPRCYRYKIERFDDTTSTTLYFGDFIETFIDEQIKIDKRYRYCITPFYQKIKGTPIILPMVNTAAPPPSESDILQKEWWNY